MAISVVVAWNAWRWWPTTFPVSYLNDSVMHESMIRFVAHGASLWSPPQLRWFANVNLGSPHLLHYQSLGAWLAGTLGRFIGTDVVFRWSLYLLWILWPVVIYVAARISQLSRPVATAAAVMSPFLVSSIFVGYEAKAYIWIGYGLWAQLLASWTLPLAWACTWRSFSESRFVPLAILAMSATVALHFETGYLAMMAVVVLPFVAPHHGSRIRTAATVVGATLVATLWVWWPVVTKAPWSAVNSTLASTPLMRGYGAPHELWWLVTGQVFDAGRLPVITVLVGVGIVVVARDWRRRPQSRAFLILFVASLCLWFGPTTWGVIAQLLPAHGDLYFRRFLIGVHLSGLFLAARGAIFVFESVADGVRRRETTSHVSFGTFAGRDVTRWLTALALIALAGGPLVHESDQVGAANAAAIARQIGARVDTADMAPLVTYLQQHRDGRVYAGSIRNWGISFSVGTVPVVDYLAQHDLDVVGLDVRTASLMSQPETHFDERYAGDYVLFGVRYVVLPSVQRPSLPMTLVMHRGPYALWSVDATSYVSIVRAVGVVHADRATVGSVDSVVRQEQLALRGETDVVAWNGAHVGPGVTTSSDHPGRVLTSQVQLSLGRADVVVRMSREGYVALSASFDPGWHVRVDGSPEPVRMLAPAVVGVRVPPGAHRVVFVYVGQANYVLMLGISASVVVVCLVALTRRRWF